MEFSITEEQKHFYEEVVRFARQALSPGAAERDQSRTFPRDLWRKCGEFGLPGLPVDAAYGGAGLDTLSTALALEALGYGSEDGGVNFALCAHLLSCVVPVWKHGTEEQKKQYLPGLCDGSQIATNAMTEPQGGSDAFHLSTHATKVETGYRINGTKTFCSNGPVADVAIVYASTDPSKGFQGGVTCFIVPKETPGFRTGQSFEKMGLRSAPLGELVFEDALVPFEAVLGGEGGGGVVFNESMEWERACLVACHVGTMQRILEEVVRYASTRVSGGQPIGKLQAVAHKIADMKVQMEASRLLAYKAAWQIQHSRSSGLDAAIAKLYGSETLKSMALDAVQIMGGNGYMKDYAAERILRDAVAATIYSGTSEIQKNIISRWLRL